MSEEKKPFVITDRRKFTKEGDLRPDVDLAEERAKAEERARKDAEAAAAAEAPEKASAQGGPEAQGEGEDRIPPPPTAEQTDQAKRAYEMTAERLDTAIRASNPGMDHPPTMTFDQLVQSVYMTTIMQLGGGTPEGQQPQVDILGARQSIDMLQVLEEKTKGNLTEEEQRLLESALFELRMAFLEITQVLARSAAAKAGSGPAPGGAKPTGPSIVR